MTGHVCEGAELHPLRLSEYQKQDWQVEDGLPENNVRMIAQTSDGQLLLATSSGLVNFDGLHFQELALPGVSEGEAANAVLVGPQGDLWIGTDGRGVLHAIDGRIDDISESAGRTNERVRMLYRDAEGTLWIATQNGIERYRDGKLESFDRAGMLSGDLTSPFAEDGYGGMLFITSEGLFDLRGNTMKRCMLKNAALGKPVAIYRDSLRRLWLGATGGLLRITAKEDGGIEEQSVAGRFKSSITTIVGDRDGQLWVGTRHDGLWRLGKDGLTGWASKDGLPDNSIRSLYLDGEGNLWIGMLTGGLSRWRIGDFAPYGKPEGFPSTYAANVLADSHGDLWLGTWGKGLFRLRNGDLIPTSPPGMPIDTPIRTLAEDKDGRLWIGTWFDGIYRYDGQSFQHYLLGVESPGNAVSVLLTDRRGGLWAGTYTGLYYFPKGEPGTLPKSHLLPSKLITCMMEEPGHSVLVGTSTGLFRVKNGEVQQIADMPHPYILSLFRDKSGYIWIGTKSGMLTLLRGNAAVALPERSGLPNYVVNSAVEDANGIMWLGTSRGVIRVTAKEMHGLADGSIHQVAARVFGRSDGFRSGEVGGPSKPGATIANDGTIWFATTTGYVHTTSAMRAGRVTEPPKISQFGWSLTDDLNIAHAEHGTNADLPPDQADITFIFSAVHLSNPGQIEFRYRLAGYDADWTTTRSRYARYRRLPIGKYKFEVEVRNSGEPWSESITAVQLRQHGHFFQSWYFYIALALFALAIGIQFFRQRVQLVKGQMGIVLEERNRIARECHDTLMAGFAAISWQLEATAKLFRDTGSTETAPAKSCELARNMVSHCQAEARRIIWDLRDSDQITNLLSEALSRTLSANHPQPSIALSFGIEGKEIPIAPAYVHHLVCIGQEAVSNAIRHASPSHIAVRVRYEPESLNLIIRDNGHGIHGGMSKVGHFGIPVMEERARKVGGVFSMKSSHSEGTEVSVSVSFKAMRSSKREQPHVTPWIGV